MINRRALPTLITICLAFISSLSWAAGNWQYYQDKAMEFYQQGGYGKAEKNANYAIKIAKKADNGKPFRASSLNLLALIQIEKGEPDAAIQSINSAISLTKEVYYDEHPQVAILLFNKGSFLEKVGKPKQAIKTYLEAWEIQKPDEVQRSEALKTVNALTRLNNEAQHYAETIILVAEYMKRRSNEPFSEALRQLSYTLADAQMQLNRVKPAQLTLQQELSREQNTLENNDVRLAETLEYLAAVLDIQGKQNSSTPLREQALTIRSTSGKTSLANIMNLNELALGSQQQSDYPKAKALYQKALAGLHELNHAQGIEQALILGNFGSLEEEQGDTKEALTLYQQSLALHGKTPTQPLQAAYTAARAGAIFYRKRNYLKAEPFFLQSLSLMEQAQAPTTSKQIALENLIALYDAWHKNRKKSKFLKQLKAMNE